MFKRFFILPAPGILQLCPATMTKTADQQSTAIDSSATKSQPATEQLKYTSILCRVQELGTGNPENSQLMTKCLQGSGIAIQQEACQLISVTQRGLICPMAGDLR